METLPSETLHQICSYLPAPDISNFRETCKVFGEIGQYYLLPVIKIKPTRESLERLLEISVHPIYSQCAHTIFYQAEQLLSIKKSHFDDFWASAATCWSQDIASEESRKSVSVNSSQSFARDRPKPLQPRDSDSPKNKDAWHSYEAAKRQQDEIIFSPETKQMFASAFAKLPKVENFYVQSSGIWVEDTDTRLFPSLDKSCLMLPQEYDIEDVRYLQGCFQLMSLLTVSYSLSLPLYELRAGRLAWRFFDIEDGGLVTWDDDDEDSFCSIDNYPNPKFSKMKDSIRHLREIRLYVAAVPCGSRLTKDQLYDEASIARIKLRSGGIGQFLSAAPDLTTLVFHAEGYDYVKQIVSLENVVGTSTWPHLRHLDLSNINAISFDLIYILENHSATLRVLKLGDISLIDRGSSWMEISTQIRGMPRLESVHITGFLSCSLTTYQMERELDACWVEREFGTAGWSWGQLLANLLLSHEDHASATLERFFAHLPDSEGSSSNPSDDEDSDGLSDDSILDDAFGSG